MFTKLARVGRNLSGRHAELLVECLLGQLEATRSGAALAASTVAGRLDPSVARDRMTEIEHRGDTQRRQLVTELGSALAVPMDREDLFRLSRSIDDVLDNLRDLVREMDLYAIEQERLLERPLERIAHAAECMQDAVGSLIERPEECRAHALQVKKNDIRRSYQRAMAELLQGDAPLTRKTMRRRELLRRVDVVGLRLGEAADCLADGAVKRSH